MRVAVAGGTGAVGKAMRCGALIPTQGATLGVQTFAEWLDGQPTSR